MAPATGARAPRGSTQQKAAVSAWVRILAIHKLALAELRDYLEGEMTLARFDLLANLVRRDGQTLASLSRSLLVTPGNLTGLVDRAARDGMLERRSDPVDRRAWRVHLTSKGQRAFRDAERRHGARVSKLFGSLTTAEVATLTRLLDKLRGDLRVADPVTLRGGEARGAGHRPPARHDVRPPRRARKT